MSTATTPHARSTNDQTALNAGKRQRTKSANRSRRAVLQAQIDELDRQHVREEADEAKRANETQAEADARTLGDAQHRFLRKCYKDITGKWKRDQKPPASLPRAEVHR